MPSMPTYYDLRENFMKILYLNTLYSPDYGGGAEVSLKTLVEGMQSLGHEVVVLTLSQDKGVSEELIDGVRVIRAGLRNIYWHHGNKSSSVYKRLRWHFNDINNTDMAQVVKEVVLSEKPDIVSCHNLSGWSVSAWKSVDEIGVPVVQVLHDLYTLCPNVNMFKANKACKQQCMKCKLFRLNHPRMSTKVKAVVGVSQYILDRHLSFGMFHEAKVKTSIKNTRNYDVSLLPEYSTDSDGVIRFGFIGTLSKAKGIEYLIREFSKLNLDHVQLIVAGTGDADYVDYIKSIAGNNVVFLGQTTPKVFYPQIDTLVVPSLWQEPLGMVVAEAFIYGIPVIGSRRGGIPEMILHKQNGYLFDPDNEGELLSLLEGIINKPSVLKAMKSDVLSSSKPFLDVEHWVGKYLDVYEQAMS